MDHDVFSELPKQAFNVILADPPWHFAVRSPKGNGRSALNHYNVMSLEEIKALPVASLAAKDCTLIMWVTDPMLQHGLEVLKAWQFTYKTVGFYWNKTNKDGSPFVGTGYWTRAGPEQALLATRGSPKRVAKDVRRLITSPRREHSRKPDEQYERIERLLGDVPRVELFARQGRSGWQSWGDQVENYMA